MTFIPSSLVTVISMASTLSYNAPFPVAAMAWANTSGPQQYLQSPNVLQRPTPVAHSPESSFRLAIGSFVEDYSNQIQVIGLNSGLPLTDPDVPPIGYDGSDFNVLASTHHGYPATKIAWEPSTSSPHSPLKRSKSELIASSSDVLKIWEYNQESNLEANSGFIHTKNGTNTPGSLNLISQLTPVSSEFLTLVSSDKRLENTRNCSTLDFIQLE